MFASHQATAIAALQERTSVRTSFAYLQIRRFGRRLVGRSHPMVRLFPPNSDSIARDNPATPGRSGALRGIQLAIVSGCTAPARSLVIAK